MSQSTVVKFSTACASIDFDTGSRSLAEKLGVHTFYEAREYKDADAIAIISDHIIGYVAHYESAMLLALLPEAQLSVERTESSNRAYDRNEPSGVRLEITRTN